MKNQQEKAVVKISIDTKGNLIRIHKNMLHLLGDPPYIQLLINPVTAEVALRSVNKKVAYDQTHRISKKMYLSDRSIEIFSKSFIDRISKLIPGLSSNSRFHLFGSVIQSEKVAVFSFSTLTPFDEEDPE